MEEEIADAFVSALTKQQKILSLVTGLKTEYRWVRLLIAINWKPLKLIWRSVKRKVLILLIGGEVDGQKGYFAQATIFDHVEPTMRIAQEEIFGPVISVIRATGFNDAIEKTNAISFGLSAGVVTNDLKNAFAFANQVEAGVIKINEPTTGVALNAPFGGFKHSSANTFKEQGQAAIDFYTRTKTIYVNHG